MASSVDNCEGVSCLRFRYSVVSNLVPVMSNDEQVARVVSKGLCAFCGGSKKLTCALTRSVVYFCSISNLRTVSDRFWKKLTCLPEAFPVQE